MPGMLLMPSVAVMMPPNFHWLDRGPPPVPVPVQEGIDVTHRKGKRVDRQGAGGRQSDAAREADSPREDEVEDDDGADEAMRGKLNQVRPTVSCDRVCTPC